MTVVWQAAAAIFAHRTMGTVASVPRADVTIAAIAVADAGRAVAVARAAIATAAPTTISRSGFMEATVA